MKKALKVIILAMLMLSASLLTVFSDEAARYTREALNMCIISVIPSLFPYMVVSSMIVSSGCDRIIGKLFPISKMYKLPENASAAIVLGAVCGFPVGAKTAVSMYKNGSISREEAEVLVAVSNNTGPSFVVSVIGTVLFKNVLFGWQLYFSQIIASVIASLVINNIIFPIKKVNRKPIWNNSSKINFFASVSDSVSSVLTVCGFITFFSVVSGFIQHIFSDSFSIIGSIITSSLEFTSGCTKAAFIGGAKGRFLAGAAVGWSGISVFCQTAAFTTPFALSMKRCIYTKALQGLITGAFAMIPLNTINAITNVSVYYDSLFFITQDSIVTAISMFLYCFLIKKVIIDHKL